MIRPVLIASAALLPQGLAAQDARAEYSTLVAAFEEATAEYRKADAKVPPLLPDRSPFHDRFLAAAKRCEGPDDALPFLGWVLQNAPRNRDAHGMAAAAIEAMARKAAEAGLDEGALFKRSREAVRHLKYNRVSDLVFAKTLLDAKSLAVGAESDSIREASARSVWKLENLQVGMVAPDIVAKDLDGEELKLSDYAGKVVVIDFWGDW